MQHVKQYVKQNKKQLQSIFASMGTDQVIEATKVYSFMQSAFDTQEFKFLLNGKSFFTQEENSDKMETLIEEYYLSKNQGQTKFYMYRVTFYFAEILEIIKFWLNKDTSITIMYKNAVESNPTEKQVIENKEKSINNQGLSTTQLNQIVNNQEEQQKSDNQFMPELSQIPAIINNYRQEINRHLENIKKQQLNQVQIKNYKEKITQLQTKINFLQESLKQKTSKRKENQKKSKTEGQNQNTRSQIAYQDLSISPRKIPKQMSPTKIQSILKSIFEFYAKQLHVTGVKASFQRIQHESNRINYQKLVHFLKQYKIFPQQSKDQKKIHHFYVKCSSNTRDLTYTGFLSLLQKLSEVVIPSQDQNRSKFQILKQSIIEQRKKNKVLNNPFHSLQREDFRIDKSSLKYEFKLMPLNGKDSEQITSELQVRRQMKQQKKSQRQHTQMQKKIRYIRKLQSIDPFHPIVQKNKHLIRQRSVMQSQPIVSMDNLEMFRDKSFDLKLLGLEDDVVELNKSESPVKGNIGKNHSYIVKNRVKEIEKLQIDKMKSLMSGIIERSNAKLEKLGISPTKRSNIY